MYHDTPDIPTRIITPLNRLSVFLLLFELWCEVTPTEQVLALPSRTEGKECLGTYSLRSSLHGRIRQHAQKYNSGADRRTAYTFHIACSQIARISHRIGSTAPLKHNGTLFCTSIGSLPPTHNTILDFSFFLVAEWVVCWYILTVFLLLHVGIMVIIVGAILNGRRLGVSVYSHIVDGDG